LHSRAHSLARAYKIVSPLTCETERRPVPLECLLVHGSPTPTAELTRLFSDVGFSVTALNRVAPALAKVQETDFHVVCIDCDMEGAVPLLRDLLGHSTNRKVVAIAICGPGLPIEEALANGANFVLQKPVSMQTARRIIHAARSLTPGEHRFRFRLPVEIPFATRVEGEAAPIQTRIFNLAENGMGISCPRKLPVDAKLAGSFVLPEIECKIEANGVVTWSTPDGRAGVRFLGMPYGVQTTLVDWLRRQFALLPYRSVRHRKSNA